MEKAVKVINIFIAIFWIAILTLVIFVVVINGMYAGKINEAEIIIGNSEKFDEEEINSAVEIILKKFKNSYTQCNLVTLEYHEEKSDREIQGDRYNFSNTIIFYASFTTGEKSIENGFSPNSTYNGWRFVLTRDSKDGEWKVESTGVM